MIRHKSPLPMHTRSRFIVFSLAEQRFAVDLLKVREIVQPEPLAIVPNAAPYLLGAMNLRSEVIGVFDLSARLGFPSGRNKYSALLIFATPSGPAAALVDRVLSVVAVEEADIDRRDYFNNDSSNGTVGLARTPGGLIPILSLVEVFHAGSKVPAIAIESESLKVGA